MTGDMSKWLEAPEPTVEHLKEGEGGWVWHSYISFGEDGVLRISRRARTDCARSIRDRACLVTRCGGKLYVQPSNAGIRFATSYHYLSLADSHDFYEAIEQVIEPPTGLQGLLNRDPFVLFVGFIIAFIIALSLFAFLIIAILAAA